MLAGSGRSEGKQTLKEATGVDAAPPKISELSEYRDAIAQCSVTGWREEGESERRGSLICDYTFSSISCTRTQHP